MALAPGTRLGPYQVIAQIGAGGMGEVYRARDTKLNRDVALKILPAAFASDGDRLARFKREAQVLASLNHPNIAAIYGFEDSGSTHALVLELVEGPTLADRIAQGAIPLNQALLIAKQTVEALEAAHEQGIIHRDLKPANLKLRPDGAVKVLDFGLAKLAESPIGAQNANRTAFPTITTPAMMTDVGVILGTAAYMSPEQAKGRPADKRSDVWAFGCVLYEMVTAKRAFEGEGISDTLARVIEREPDFSLLPPQTHPSIVRLLRRTLAKDPRMRIPDIAMARIEIEEAMAAPAVSSRGSSSRWFALIPWVVIALLMVLFVVSRLRPGSSVSSGRTVARLEVNPPPGVELYTGAPSAVTLSPDGAQVAFIGYIGGVRKLFVRRLDRFEAVPVSGTETAQTCYFAADGGAVAFILADRTLKRVSLADGLVVSLARDADSSVGAVWGSDDRITFGHDNTLWQIPASGGQPRQITTLDREKGELLHAFPTSLGDGASILFTSVAGAGRDVRIEALSLATGKRSVIVEAGSVPLYASSGHLIFSRNGSLLAVPFDVGRLKVKGSAAVRVAENLAVDAAAGSPLVSVSTSGSLLFPPSGSGTSRLVWVSREGVEEPITDVPRRYSTPRLAPDGRRIVVSADGSLWIQDSVRATLTLLKSQVTWGTYSIPVWTPDGKRIVARSRTGMEVIDVDSGHMQAVSGSTTIADFPASVSPDGETLAFVRQGSQTSGDIYTVGLRGESKPRPLINTPAYDGGAQFSPDGHWIAYVSDESGQMEVYLRPFPGPDRRVAVSTKGGTHPLWNRNGRELFYRDGNKMMAVAVSTSPELKLSQPTRLFEQQYGSATITIPNYDVSPDGQRFLMVKDEPGTSRLNLVLNWFEELTQRVPAK